MFLPKPTVFHICATRLIGIRLITITNSRRNWAGVEKFGFRLTREELVGRDVQNCHGQLSYSKRMGTRNSRAGGTTNYMCEDLPVLFYG